MSRAAERLRLLLNKPPEKCLSNALQDFSFILLDRSILKNQWNIKGCNRTNQSDINYKRRI